MPSKPCAHKKPTTPPLVVMHLYKQRMHCAAINPFRSLNLLWYFFPLDINGPFECVGRTEKATPSMLEDRGRWRPLLCKFRSFSYIGHFLFTDFYMQFLNLKWIEKNFRGWMFFSFFKLLWDSHLLIRLLINPVQSFFGQLNLMLSIDAAIFMRL